VRQKLNSAQFSGPLLDVFYSTTSVACTLNYKLPLLGNRRLLSSLTTTYTPCFNLPQHFPVVEAEAAGLGGRKLLRSTETPMGFIRGADGRHWRCKARSGLYPGEEETVCAAGLECIGNKRRMSAESLPPL
jgi:hypothetical protein